MTMQAVMNEDEVREAFAAIKRPGEPFLTNMYLDAETIASSVRTEALSRIDGDGAIAFLLRDRDVDRLYFVTRSPETLAALLASLASAERGSIVSDLVGPLASTEPLENAFAEAGFRRHALFQRMARSGGSAIGRDEPADETQIERARPAESAELAALLLANFDPLSEHLPSTAEIRAAAERKWILVARRSESTAGMLFFDRVGVSSTLRYWLVDPRFRGAGVGGALLGRYLFECRDAKRLLLWVDTTNHAAIAAYERSGYRADGAFDTIMLRRE